jgi:hypothetical protein
MLVATLAWLKHAMKHTQITSLATRSGKVVAHSHSLSPVDLHTKVFQKKYTWLRT